jgi:Holliday junction resolvase RusA-like endonuclease
VNPLVFSISVTPRAKGRPRATVRGGFAKLYTDDLTRKYEAAIKSCAVMFMAGRAPLEGPLSVSLRFRLQPPKSMTKRLRAAVLAGEEAYQGSCDADNLAKAVLDPLNKVCWGDDVQIMRLFITKAASERAGIDIKIQPLAEFGE